jgi:hypothetical protein
MSLLLQLLKEPVPTEPVILDFSYMNKSMVTSSYMYSYNQQNQAISSEQIQTSDFNDPTFNGHDCYFYYVNEPTTFFNNLMASDSFDHDYDMTINKENNDNKENCYQTVQQSSVSNMSFLQSQTKNQSFTNLIPTQAPSVDNSNDCNNMNSWMMSCFSVNIDLEPASEFDNFYFPQNSDLDSSRLLD